MVKQNSTDLSWLPDAKRQRVGQSDDEDDEIDNDDAGNATPQPKPVSSPVYNAGTDAAPPTPPSSSSQESLSPQMKTSPGAAYVQISDSRAVAAPTSTVASSSSCSSMPETLPIATSPESAAEHARQSQGPTPTPSVQSSSDSSSRASTASPLVQVEDSFPLGHPRCLEELELESDSAAPNPIQHQHEHQHNQSDGQFWTQKQTPLKGEDISISDLPSMSWSPSHYQDQPRGQDFVPLPVAGSDSNAPPGNTCKARSSLTVAAPTPDALPVPVPVPVSDSGPVLVNWLPLTPDPAPTPTPSSSPTSALASDSNPNPSTATQDAEKPTWSSLYLRLAEEDPNLISHCKALLEYIPNDFGTIDDYYTEVYSRPGKILQSLHLDVALYAHLESTSSDTDSDNADMDMDGAPTLDDGGLKRVRMYGNPQLQRKLERLAEEGIGGSICHDGVVWSFRLNTSSTPSSDDISVDGG